MLTKSVRHVDYRTPLLGGRNRGPTREVLSPKCWYDHQTASDYTAHTKANRALFSRVPNRDAVPVNADKAPSLGLAIILPIPRHVDCAAPGETRKTDALDCAHIEADSLQGPITLIAIMCEDLLSRLQIATSPRQCCWLDMQGLAAPRDLQVLFQQRCSLPCVRSPTRITSVYGLDAAAHSLHISRLFVHLLQRGRTVPMGPILLQRVPHSSLSEPDSGKDRLSLGVNRISKLPHLNSLELDGRLILSSEVLGHHAEDDFEYLKITLSRETPSG